MTAIAEPTIAELTPAEVERLSDQDGKLYELVDGNLAEKAMSTHANYVATRIAHRLMTIYAESQAYVFTEQPTYCFENLRQMRRPDVALVWAHRLPAGLSDDELLIPPDLVVEVVSPTNTYNEIFSRRDQYLSAGVPLVWIVGPEQREVHAYRDDRSVQRYRDGSTIADEPLLPGLALPVADIFPAMAPPPPAPGPLASS